MCVCIYIRLVHTLGVSTYRDSQEVCRTMTDSTLENILLLFILRIVIGRKVKENNNNILGGRKKTGGGLV